MRLHKLVTQPDGSKQYQDPSPWRRGDCTLIGPAGPNAPWSGPLIILNPDGSGKFTGYGLSTDTNDQWKWHLELLDSAKNILAYVPSVTLFGQTVPGDWTHDMTVSNNWYGIFRDFKFDPALFARVSSVRAPCDC